MTWRCKINGYTRIFGLKETDKLKNTVYDGDGWRRFRDRQNAGARARRKARKMNLRIGLRKLAGFNGILKQANSGAVHP